MEPAAQAPLILWFRRDLRLGDNPMLAEAAATGRPLLPVFIRDDVVARAPAAPRWRWGLGVARFREALEGAGSRLTLRSGPAPEALAQLAHEAGAAGVWFARLHDPEAAARDRDVAERLAAEGVEARAFGGHLLFDPDAIRTKTGDHYKVFTPMWRALRAMEAPPPAPTPAALAVPAAWPESEALEDWRFGAAMNRGAEIVARHVTVGEDAARARLARFLDERVGAYTAARDRPAVEGGSSLSENLTYGEIGIRECWHAALPHAEEGSEGAETFLKELAWREFAWQLVHHTPRIVSDHWRGEWGAFPWQGEGPDFAAWTRGRTGIPFVDAAMREMYVTGRMHNRGRMIAASYLTKHLLTDWRLGSDWFANHLIDWDVANNAMGWQWIAGSGPDASPFFRVFNPDGQLAKFDPKGAYPARWIAEGQSDPTPEALSYFEAIPRSWALSPSDPYPAPPRPLAEGRERALAAYRARRGEPAEP